MTPAAFVAMFCEHMGCKPSSKINRIEFEYVEIASWVWVGAMPKLRPFSVAQKVMMARQAGVPFMPDEIEEMKSAELARGKA